MARNSFLYVLKTIIENWFFLIHFYARVKFQNCEILSAARNSTSAYGACISTSAIHFLSYLSLSSRTKEILTIYFLSFSQSLNFNFSDQSESNCNLMAIGLHLATTSNLGIGILERRDPTALIVSSRFEGCSHFARNPAVISKCVTRARWAQPQVEEIGSRSFKTEPSRPIESIIRSASACSSKRSTPRSPAREEITFIRTNYPSACGIEASVRLHVCDLR